MKKIIGVLMTVSLSVGLCMSVVYADSEIEDAQNIETQYEETQLDGINDVAQTGNVKNVELAYPHRVYLYGNTDGASGTEAASPLKVNNESVTTDDPNLKATTVTGRTILYKKGLQEEGGTDTEKTINDAPGTLKWSPILRTMGAYKESYNYGLMFWKNNFTYEFDFRVDTLEDKFQLNLATTKLIQFTKDSDNEQYYIKWVDPEKSISGKNLEYGKTYHLRIEADTEKGANLFAIFTDPEDNYVYTSFVPNPVSSTLAERATSTATYNVRMRCVGEVSITTSNEELYIERYFIMPNELKVEENSTAVTASATVYNGTSDNQITEIPYLFVGIYDSIGAMVKNTGQYKMPEGKYVPKLANVGTADLSAAKYEYLVSVDISDLPDGEYIVKAFMWRSPNEPIVCSAVQEKTITVEKGIIKTVS